jgi:cytochrome P450
MAIPIFISAIGVCVTYLVVSQIHSRITVARFKAANGCLPLPELPQREKILGLDLLKETAQQTKDKTVLPSTYARIQANADTYTNVIAFMTLITTVDPINVQAILTSKFEDFGLGGRIYAWGPLVGNGIFTSDGKLWEHRRALLRPNFHKQQIASLDMFEKHLQHMVAQIPTNGETFDLQKLFFSMTLDSATEFLFGHSVGATGSGEGSEAEKFQTAFDFAQHCIPDRNRLGKMNLLVRNKKFDAACKEVHDWADKYVAQTLAARKEKKDEEKEVEGGRKKYIVLNEIADELQDPRLLRDEMLNLLLAGRDTTAGLLSNCFFALARNQRVWEKLREEIETTLEGRLPTYDDLKNMKYLKAVLNESKSINPLPNLVSTH